MLMSEGQRSSKKVTNQHITYPANVTDQLRNLCRQFSGTPTESDITCYIE